MEYRLKTVILIFLQLLTVSLMGQEKVLRFGLDGDGLDFEFTGDLEYIQSDTISFWQVGNPQKQILTFPDNPTLFENALFTDTSLYYRNNVKASFQLKLVILDNGTDLYSFYFYRKYDFEKNIDGCVVETSWNMGQTWQNIIFDSVIIRNKWDASAFSNFYTDQDSIKSNPGQVGFTGLNFGGGFSNIIFLRDNSLIGDTLLIKFTVTSDSTDSNNEGLLIDEINAIGQHFDYVESTTDNIQFNIYPNPVLDRLNIYSKLDLGKYAIKIFNSSGQIILSKDLSGKLNVFDISKLQKGIYIISIISNNSSNTYRFIKL